MDINLLKIIGLGLTLQEWQEEHLSGGKPFFEEEDIHFACTHCGQCCSEPGVVYITPYDLERISSFFNVDPDQIVYNLLAEDADTGELLIPVDDNQPCPFFQEERCIVHEVKPIQCRTYPFWPELVGTQETWQEAIKACPGIGEGRQYKPDEIKKLLLGIGETQPELPE